LKIIDVIPHVLTTELSEPFAFSQGWVEKRSTMIVEIVTDEGITGWGESLCHGLQPPEIAASFVQFCFKPLLIGRDPFDVEVLWEEMYNRSRPFGQGGAAVNAISGVDIALWDVIGRKLEKPVHKLLGGALSQVYPPLHYRSIRMSQCWNMTNLPIRFAKILFIMLSGWRMERLKFQLNLELVWM